MSEQHVPEPKKHEAPAPKKHEHRLEKQVPPKGKAPPPMSRRGRTASPAPIRRGK